MSSKNSNKLNVPEARAAMDKFKMEAASEVDVPSTYKILYHRRYMTHYLKRLDTNGVQPFLPLRGQLGFIQLC